MMKFFGNYRHLICTTFLIISCGSNPDTNFVPEPGAESANSADLSYKISKEWLIGNSRQEDIQLQTGFGLVSHEFLLEQKPLTVETFDQINRPIQSLTYYQGHDGNRHSESFKIAEAGLFDLLIVMDDSDSMDGYQQKLASALPSILKYIGTTNWRIAVATTSDSCLRQTSDGLKILTRGYYEADPIAAQESFRQLIDVGVRSSYERGILMAADALEGKCGQDIQPWLRPQAEVSVLLVTDEQNCGSASNEGCVGEPWEDPSYLTEKFDPVPVVNGLLLLQDPPAGSDTSCKNSGYYENPPNPTNYIELITLTGGIYDDICTSDYQRVLEQISQSVRDKVNVQFELAYEPIGISDVLIDGQAVSDYTIEGHILTVHGNIEEGADSLSINYLHSPVPRSRFFATNMGVDTSTLEVFLDEVKLDPDAYSFQAQNQQVELKQGPPDRSKIQLVFRDDTPLHTDFVLNRDALEDSVVLLVNGAARNDFTINLPTRTLSLAQPPLDNATIEIQYAVEGDKTLEYQTVGVDSHQIEDLRVLDMKTGQALEVGINLDGKLEFPQHEIYHGRKVRAEYNLDFSESERRFTIPVAAEMVPDSLRIIAAGNLDTCSHDLVINEGELSFFCQDEDFEAINISYTVVEDYTNTFTLDFDYAGLVRWEVYLNNKEFADYHLFNKTVVILKDHLTPGTKVQINAIPIQ